MQNNTERERERAKKILWESPASSQPSHVIFLFIKFDSCASLALHQLHHDHYHHAPPPPPYTTTTTTMQCHHALVHITIASILFQSLSFSLVLLNAKLILRAYVDFSAFVSVTLFPLCVRIFFSRRCRGRCCCCFGGVRDIRVLVHIIMWMCVCCMYILNDMYS